LKIVSVVGARPQFVKLAAIAAAFKGRRTVTHQIIHTGQHYDRNMSDVFFDELGIPRPDISLGVGSGSHGEQTGSMMAGLDRAFREMRPDGVIVYGDTNSTLAGAISAVKLEIFTAHLEAGLRSFNRSMPEEINRVLTDHSSDLLLPPTQHALDCLRAEGIGDRAIVVGDVMTDICLRTADTVQREMRPLRTDLPQSGQFVLVTVHRAENTATERRLRHIIRELSRIPVRTVVAVHPRLARAAKDFHIDLAQGMLMPVPPLAYSDLVRALKSCAGVVTDSGGLQKEAYLLGVPCTTIRTETEWPETVDEEWNVLDPQLESVVEMSTRVVRSNSPRIAYGDGQAADRAVTATISAVELNASRVA